MKSLTIVYTGLLTLLALTVMVSFLPLSPWGAAISVSIATAKAVLILIFFMKLRESSSSLRLLALAALLWLVFLFGLTSSDYLTRGMTGILGK